MNKPGTFTVVVSILSSDKKLLHYGVIYENEKLSLSGAYKTDDFYATEFQSEKETNPAVFHILANRESFLNSIPNYKGSSKIEILIEAHEENSLFKVVYKIQL